MAKKPQKNAKEVTYQWKGLDRRGKPAKGEISGTNAALVKATLRKQGIIPKKVNKKPISINLGKPKIRPEDISVFTRQMSTMMTAGVPLVQSFEIIGKGHDNISMQELVLSIKSDVESGESFHNALKKHPRQFDDLYCNLIDAGEKSGALEQLLSRIATYKEKTESIKKKIKKAMTYPIAILTIAGIVTSILLIYVVPQFAEIFAGFGAELPAFTQMVINLSEGLQAHGIKILIAMIAAGFVFKEAVFRSKKFAASVDRVKLKLPIIGDILTKGAIARFARTLETTFAAGVPLVEALDSVAGATGNVVYTEAVLQIRDDVSTGIQMNVAMGTSAVFPNMVVQMVAIGEEAGAIDTMLSKVADIYEEEVDNMVDNLSTLIEPFIMAILGVLVGGLVVSMYLPIFQMGDVVG